MLTSTNPTSLDLEAFASRYGHSQRRRLLIGILEREMTRITELEGTARCLVFGSMVTTDKPDPADIDVIVSVSSHRMPAEWLNAGELWHAFPVRMTPPLLPASPGEMVRGFNRKLAEGFSLDLGDCVELVFPTTV